VDQQRGALTKPVVVGHSMGGNGALELAARAILANHPGHRCPQRTISVRLSSIAEESGQKLLD
jgi:pimeloyl-ACP methyl ester carboxylesterase